VRGPNITPGYWRREDLTAAAFDEEGFYRPGDAVRFLDPADPAQGVAFDGRLAEDFKLGTGTWVNVGVLRVAALAAASPIMQDAVVTGENRDYAGLLVWLNPAGCQKLLGTAAPTSVAELARHETVREHLGRSIARWCAGASSSQRIRRIVILHDAPSIDANEITDKGYVNQRLALQRRRAEVERLYGDPPGSDVIVIDA
jgi:feruloyl-CoA synthase